MIRKYGPESLPAGPGIEESDSLIIVEGRADVLNLLRHGFRNCIAVEGTSIPKTVISLSEQRISTAFLDGDRGGELILKELLEVADIDYVARAAEGREVEELSGKEVLKTLRNKVPVEQILKELEIDHTIPYKQTPLIEKQKEILIDNNFNEEVDSEDLEISLRSKEGEWDSKEGEKPSIPSEIQERINELEPREAILVDQNYKITTRVPVSNLRITLQNTEKIHGAVFDGILTQRLVDVAQEQGLKFLAGAKVGELTKKPTELDIYKF